MSGGEGLGGWLDRLGVSGGEFAGLCVECRREVRRARGRDCRRCYLRGKKREERARGSWGPVVAVDESWVRWVLDEAVYREWLVGEQAEWFVD